MKEFLESYFKVILSNRGTIKLVVSSDVKCKDISSPVLKIINLEIMGELCEVFRTLDSNEWVAYLNGWETKVRKLANN